MRKKFIRLTAACVLTALVLYSGGLKTQPAAATAIPATSDQPLEQQAQLWVDELANQPHFEKWKLASLQISPIGPGTHSWLVLVKQNKETVGYLVVNAVENGGFQLGEYGTSRQPLFDDQTLSRSIKQLELLKPADKTEALYIHPLLAAWKVTADQETYFTDAASGELLPVESKDWLAASYTPLIHAERMQAPASAKLLKHVSLPSFDRYARLPWLTKEPLQVGISTYSSLFAKINSKEQLRYTAELFEGQMLYVWSIVGYNKWDSGHLYLALEAGEDGSERRYVPLLLLIELGHFYR
ncbi:hypothetical protein [Paenibacillus prosopidis]|uniref:Uncharacterized protein n=1 Tax=Paenibacillus prosopidis TaxID=630520 RepID=A0A368W3E2_9BACL|nr:hypothetical protein [Paenibacillus prosopidis]RCW49353.1 hypothetical protein DFP97_1049 [Paenibacillus prosopidis]